MSMKSWAQVVLTLLFASMLAAQTSVTTHHYDHYRTGWNRTETVLMPSNVWANFAELCLLQTHASVLVFGNEKQARYVGDNRVDLPPSLKLRRLSVNSFDTAPIRQWYYEQSIRGAWGRDLECSSEQWTDAYWSPVEEQRGFCRSIFPSS